ncbi:2Fe-2S iron-sulfur cluster binding domain-containing protein [Aquabacterium sp. A7-Y]|uniref:2Fe-2S iron-sulfur cluster binding domain-containing protein n=1 Tax=Aquabacterium sp. A7-Y TaxID=1349605 RepID=UPI00223D6EC3|nr:2Fe-2S iron-sulfur cluster binding domain-containing protein [Aquabacterium sp. A7-Y]MCW7539592.1 2Fe-2S iron-sulfur cluster binding domain-containing protein [Aquabacterium sp. A7-Y]
MTGEEGGPAADPEVSRVRLHTVSIPGTGETFSLPDGAYLSDAAELELAGLIFGCRAGACGICTIEIVEGAANVSRQDEGERGFVATLGYAPEKVRLACQCQLRGDISIRQC